MRVENSTHLARRHSFLEKRANGCKLCKVELLKSPSTSARPLHHEVGPQGRLQVGNLLEHLSYIVWVAIEIMRIICIPLLHMVLCFLETCISSNLTVSVEVCPFFIALHMSKACNGFQRSYLV